MSATFENVGEAHEVGLDINVRVRERGAYPGLSGHVHDAIEALHLKQARYPLFLLQAHLNEAEVLTPVELCQAIPLQIRVVVFAQVVETDHRVPLRQQASGDVKANKP